MCFQVRYAVAGSDSELTSQSSGWLVEKTNHGGNLVDGYSNVAKVANYVDELMQGKTKFRGGAFGMEVLAGELSGRAILSFEAKIEEDGDDESKCRFDIHHNDGSKEVFMETKNYAAASPFSDSFYSQFLIYISSSRVQDITQIKYYFRSNSGVNETDLVQKFVDKVNSKVVNKTDLFNIMNTGLKLIYGIRNESDITDIILNNMFNNIIEVY
jgi:hypothetical protein